MNILIVEDEKVAARRLERLTKEILGDKLESIRCIDTLKKSEKFLEKHPIDILLLDLNLSGQDGFNLLKRAVSESFQTIVVSANTDRALESYEYGVLDFIPKPFDKKRLIKAFQRLEYADRISRLTTKMLVVKNFGRLQLVPLEEIHFIKGAGDYSEIHTVKSTVFLHNKSLEALVKILPEHFTRIHKSYIADLDQIVNVHIFGGGKYECELTDGTRIPVSRTRYKDLTERLEKPNLR